jgi:hypothetical protein
MLKFSWPLRPVSHLFLVLILVDVMERHAAAQPPPTVGSGVVEGRVVDAATGEPLPGAQVLVTDSAAETSTDRDGRFRLSGFRRATEQSSFTYLGRQDATVEAKVVAGATQRLDIQMRMVAFEESVSVPGQLILDAQERALNQQKTAPNITNVVSADQIGSFPGPQRRRDDAAHSRRLDHQGSGRGTLCEHPRHRAAAQLDDDRRAADSVARSAHPSGRSRRRAVGAAAVDRSLQGAHARHGRRLDRRQRQPRDEAGAGEAAAVWRRRRRLQRASRHLQAEQLQPHDGSAGSTAARPA